MLWNIKNVLSVGYKCKLNLVKLKFMTEKFKTWNIAKQSVVFKLMSSSLDIAFLLFHVVHFYYFSQCLNLW